MEELIVVMAYFVLPVVVAVVYTYSMWSSATKSCPDKEI